MEGKWRTLSSLNTGGVAIRLDSFQEKNWAILLFRDWGVATSVLSGTSKYNDRGEVAIILFKERRKIKRMMEGWVGPSSSIEKRGVDILLLQRN